MECELESRLLEHLRALSDELRYRIGEVQRALERLKDAERRLTAGLQQTQEPPF